MQLFLLSLYSLNILALECLLKSLFSGIYLSLFIGRVLIAELINGLFGLLNHLSGVVANIYRFTALFILRCILLGFFNSLINIILGHIGG